MTSQLLTDRQQAIVELIADGFWTYDSLAEEMDMSRSTVRDEVVNMCDRFDCHMKELPNAAGVLAA